MNPNLRAIATLIGAGFVWLTPCPAQAAPGAAGYWEGSITLPNTKLGIGVQLLTGTPGAWNGTISIQAQGLRDYPLTNVTVKGTTVAFALPGIPGDPAFTGTLAADGKSISGDFSQSGQTLPFSLERKASKPAVPGAPTPAKGVPGKGWIGHWQGSLKPAPNVELRLALEITNSPAGKLSAVLVSLDQGEARIPVTTTTAKENTLTLDIDSIGGRYEGKLNPDGSEIAGDWTQAGQSSPLAFKRLPARNPGR